MATAIAWIAGLTGLAPVRVARPVVVTNSLGGKPRMRIWYSSSGSLIRQSVRGSSLQPSIGGSFGSKVVKP